MAPHWQIKKFMPTLTLSGNFGVGQVQLALGADVERVGRLGEMDFASKVGPSPMNLGGILTVVGNLHDLNLKEEMHMDALSVENVTEQLEKVNFKLGLIARPGQLTLVEAKLDSGDAQSAMIASLFLCISHTVGDKSAVRCIKSFLMKLAKEASSGSRIVDGAWLETYLEKLRKSIFLVGCIPEFERVVEEYNEMFHQGLPWNEGYVKPVEKVVEVLLEKLAQSSDNTGASTPSVWWTRSRKVHKLAYLLCYMGWNVSVESYPNDLPKPHKTNVIVKFTSDVDVEGDLIESTLYPAGVSAPKRLPPSVEDEQGPGVLLREDGLAYAVRAVLELKHVEGRAIEHAWKLGYDIGEKCKVELVFGKTECSYRFGESTLKHEEGSSWDALDDIMYEIDRSLKKYGPMVDKVLGGRLSEYHNLSDRLRNIFKNRNAELFGSTGNPEDVAEDDQLRKLVAFYLGLVYGKLRALLVATGLKDATGNWAKDFTPLEFRVGWMDFMGQFLHDVHAKMWQLSTTNKEAPNMHSVFLFIGMCCSSKSTYFGKQVQLEDIVGFWTGTSLVMLAAAMKPGIDPKNGAKLENYPVWMLNLSTVDGVHLQSSKWIEGEVRMRNLSTCGGSDTLPDFEIPPQFKLNIYLSPNYVEGNAKVVHSMMCKGDVVYVAPVMGALVNLHKKIITCSFGVRYGTCDGTDGRLRCCRGGFPMYVGEFILGHRPYHGDSGDDNAKMPAEVGVIMARDDIPWRYAASCIYHDRHFVIAGSCLSCAREGTVDEKWGEYII